MHETSGFRHRSCYQDPNHMVTTVKRRDTVPTTSEDEKTNTTEDEKTSAVLTTTQYSRRTWQRSMCLNGKIVAFRAFEQDLSRTSNNNYFVRNVSTGVIDISSPNYNSYVRECVYCRDLSVSCRAKIDSRSIFLKDT
jgi:hypothetical protein